MSAVTKVLRSVGVTRSTVQPEFAPDSESSAGSVGDASPVLHREDPGADLACSLACGKVCTGSMCCSPVEEETHALLAPPAGETKEEPQTLVIENTFLWMTVYTKDLEKNKLMIWHPFNDVKVKTVDVIHLKTLPAHYVQIFC